MGFIRGRHAEVMTSSEVKRAKRRKGLPDVYVGSAEREVEFFPDNFSALLHVESTLAEDVKRQIECEEGIAPPSPRLIEDV
jgi:hypothetical protein